MAAQNPQLTRRAFLSSALAGISFALAGCSGPEPAAPVAPERPTVYEEDAVPDNAMLLANVARGYRMNVQEEISLLRDEYMTKRQTEFMGYAILDGKPITTKAFVYLKKSA